MNFAVIDRFSATAFQRLKLSKALTESPSQDAQILITRTKNKIDAAFLDRSPNLKFVVTATSGFDHIDVKECETRGIRVSFCPEGNVHSAAELTLLLALALSRKLSKAQAAIKKGRWERDLFLGHELYEKTWGILGFGRIGRKVAKLAQAFGMEVVACDPFVEDEGFEKLSVERLGLKELYTAADVLSLHVPLTDKTKSIVNIRTMEHMSSHLMLINTSRGGVVQEADVIEGLRRGMIAGFALDVYQEEPLNPKAALLDLENVVCTPHIGANTFEAFERSCHLAVDKVLAFTEGKAVSDNPLELPWL